MKETVRGKIVNGWQIALDMGRYGKKYAYRAGGHFTESAEICRRMPSIHSVRKTSKANLSTEPNKYTLTFKKEEIPPVNAFWSLTMYDKDAFLVDNPINRYALGDRSGMKSGNDGSLTLFIQSDSPGKDKESNWLPPDTQDEFKLALRLYAPKKEVADGTWAPPAVKKVS